MRPWICHKCGEATTGEACSYCMTRVLPDAGVYHPQGSIFAIMHGFRGIYALPKDFAFALRMLEASKVGIGVSIAMSVFR